MIKASNISIESGRAHGGGYACIDASPIIGHQCYKLVFFPDGGFYALAKRADSASLFLLMAPTADYQADLEADGYTIIQVLNAELAKQNSQIQEGEASPAMPGSEK